MRQREGPGRSLGAPPALHRAAVACVYSLPSCDGACSKGSWGPGGLGGYSLSFPPPPRSRRQRLLLCAPQPTPQPPPPAPTTTAITPPHPPHPTPGPPGNASYYTEAQRWYRQLGADNLSPYVDWDDTSSAAALALVRWVLPPGGWVLPWGGWVLPPGGWVLPGGSDQAAPASSAGAAPRLLPQWRWSGRSAASAPGRGVLAWQPRRPFPARYGCPSPAAVFCGPGRAAPPPPPPTHPTPHPPGRAACRARVHCPALARLTHHPPRSAGLRQGAAKVPAFGEFTDFLDSTFLQTYISADGEAQQAQHRRRGRSSLCWTADLFCL